MQAMLGDAKAAPIKVLSPEEALIEDMRTRHGARLVHAETRAERLLVFTMTFTLRPARYLEIGTFFPGTPVEVDPGLLVSRNIRVEAVASYDAASLQQAVAFLDRNAGRLPLEQVVTDYSLDDINRAKAFCLGCDVRTQCLESALMRREPWGVWGGELFLHGKVLAHKRKRGRPPKVRPPEPELPSDPFEGLIETA